MVKEVQRVREVHLTLTTRDGEEVALRLWTSLRNPLIHTAEALGELYAQRWEIEGYYRHLKHAVHDGTLLESQTPETALQDAYCIVLASHLEARARLEAARASKSNLKLLSLPKTIDLIVGLWQFCQLAQDMLADAQIRLLHERLYAKIARFCTTRKRRDRT